MSRGALKAFTESQQEKQAKEKSPQEEPKAPAKVEGAEVVLHAHPAPATVEPKAPAKVESAEAAPAKLPLDEGLKKRGKAALTILAAAKTLRGELKSKQEDALKKVREPAMTPSESLIVELEGLAKEATAELKARDRVNPRLEDLDRRLKALAGQAEPGELSKVKEAHEKLQTVDYRVAEKEVGALEGRGFALEKQTAEAADKAQKEAVKRAQAESERLRQALSNLKAGNNVVNAANLKWANDTLQDLPKKNLNSSQQAAKGNAEALLSKKAELDNLTSAKVKADEQIIAAQERLTQTKHQVEKAQGDEAARVEKVRKDEEELLKQQYAGAADYLAMAKETKGLVAQIDDLARNNNLEGSDLAKRLQGIEDGVSGDRNYERALPELRGLKEGAEVEKARLEKLVAERAEYLAAAKETSKLLEEIDGLAGNGDAADSDLAKRLQGIDQGAGKDHNYKGALLELGTLTKEAEDEKARLRRLAAERAEFSGAYLPLKARFDALSLEDSGATSEDLGPVQRAHERVLGKSDLEKFVEAKELLTAFADKLVVAEKQAASWKKVESAAPREPRERVANWDGTVAWIVREVLAAFGRRFDFAGPSVYLSAACPKDLYPPDQLQGLVRTAFRSKSPATEFPGKGLFGTHVFVVESGPGKRDNYNVKVKISGQKAVAQIHVVYE